MKSEETVSAQVVLRPASGRTLDGKSIIVSENIGEFAPSSRSFARVSRWFAATGFKIEPLVGISFAISAPVSTFESVFKTRLKSDKRGGVQAAAKDGSTGYELPLEAIPKDIGEQIVAVTFTPPPDFGPGKFGP